jgi:hypothetical protein
MYSPYNYVDSAIDLNTTYLLSTSKPKSKSTDSLNKATPKHQSILKKAASLDSLVNTEETPLQKKQVRWDLEANEAEIEQIHEWRRENRKNAWIGMSYNVMLGGILAKYDL